MLNHFFIIFRPPVGMVVYADGITAILDGSPFDNGDIDITLTFCLYGRHAPGKAGSDDEKVGFDNFVGYLFQSQGHGFSSPPRLIVPARCSERPVEER